MQERVDLIASNVLVPFEIRLDGKPRRGIARLAPTFMREMEQRIDVVEKMGHLERADADFLMQATTYLRAVDHACRVVLGRAEEKLPAEPHDREKLAKLVQIWTRRTSTTAPLEDELVAIQHKLRRLFDSVFY